MHLFDAPRRGTPCDINVVYTPLKSTFSGLQFRRRQYGHIVICLAIIGSQNVRNSAKFRENSNLY